MRISSFTWVGYMSTKPITLKVLECFFATLCRHFRVHIVTCTEGWMVYLQINGMKNISNKIAVIYLKHSMPRSMAFSLNCF